MTVVKFELVTFFERHRKYEKGKIEQVRLISFWIWNIQLFYTEWNEKPSQVKTLR